MDNGKKTPKELFQEFPVIDLGWTQVPDPIKIFGRLHRKIHYLQDLYVSARTFYDRYMASLEYEVILEDNKNHKKKHEIQPKYAVIKDRKQRNLNQDIPTVKEVLPNHIAKDLRNDIPTVAECVRVRRENADYHRICRFGKIV